MKPVAANATFWLTESFSGGLVRSLTPAATRHHFIIGAQKKTVEAKEEEKMVYQSTSATLDGKSAALDEDYLPVFGPAGWFINAWKRDEEPAAAAIMYWNQ